MNKRLSKFGRNWLRACCVVTVCGAVYSCSDDYELDDKTPDWLNSSIYEYLQTGDKYKDFVRLIDDLGMDTVLSKTGSKTLFVADNDAFAEFYQNNPWKVRRYEDLSLAQKKLLFNNAVVNNAYLLEMMSSIPSATTPIKGECLRRVTSATATDSVPYFTADELPVSYNPDDKDYWARFRQKGGMHLALDATSPMMLHFLEAYLSQANITNEDFKVITGRERQSNDAFVYDNKVLEADIRCENGYVNRLDKVLLVPQNMAEVLRTNGQTNIMSHMIDRFSAPFYNEELTNRYKLIYGNTVDSIFEKRYFSSRSKGGNALMNDQGTDPKNNPTGTDVKYGLLFDPGWNEYASLDLEKEVDMGVIFAPIDDVLYEYFFTPNGAGYFLIDAFAKHIPVSGPTDYENIYKAIDLIPFRVISALTNNLMKDYFKDAVPSKFMSLTNDVRDPMFEEGHQVDVRGTKLANNGLIYLMGEVLSPARYAAVSAPALVAEDMQVFNYAIRSGSDDNPSSLGNLTPHFYAYLEAMSSRFSFFVPKDGFYYIDPVSFLDATVNGTSLVGKAYRYDWDTANNGKAPKVTQFECIYDLKTNTVTSMTQKGTVTSAVWGDRLRDMLETHTIVHEDEETATGIETNKNFFLAKNGAPIYVGTSYDGNESRRVGMEVKGGLQMDLSGDFISDDISIPNSPTVVRFDNQTKGGNGMAYQIDSPLMPTIKSVYSVMYNDSLQFGEFFKLCQTDTEVLKEAGIEQATDQKRYNIFVPNGGLPCYDNGTGAVKEKLATNVRFFNNYRYTVYIPTNEEIQKAVTERGLPTWESIRTFLELDKDIADRTDYEGRQEELAARNAKARVMIEVLVNFVKYHFQDNSVFVDLPSFNAEYSSATIDRESRLYCKIQVSSSGNNLEVKGEGNAAPCSVTEDNNILTRDYVISGTNISASSFAVVHGIDGVLDYKTYKDGRYDSEWATQEAMDKYLAKYRIEE